jgi:cytochrome c553
MKRASLVVLLLSLVGASVCISAEIPANLGPEIIKLKMGDLVLPFKHRAHQVKLNNECYHCHATKIGKIDNWGKDTAHDLCISCHEIDDKGPVECKQCHNKVYSKSDKAAPAQAAQ